jgi:hypothetical protein
MTTTFSRRVFKIAALYGFIAIPPMYFLEAKTGRDFPPSITHPEYYYGFAGVALAFQALFWILARDPIRFRPMMIPSILEKLGFGLAVFALVFLKRTTPVNLIFGSIDLIFALLFLITYLKTPERA